ERSSPFARAALAADANRLALVAAGPPPLPIAAVAEDLADALVQVAQLDEVDATAEAAVTAEDERASRHRRHPTCGHRQPGTCPRPGPAQPRRPHGCCKCRTQVHPYRAGGARPCRQPR